MDQCGIETVKLGKLYITHGHTFNWTSVVLKQMTEESAEGATPTLLIGPVWY